jgi:PAS domain S-box-containing protein
MADYLSGYHTYCLDEPYHLDYVSMNLCNIIGYTPEEIKTIFKNDYTEIVYENDRDKFLNFINELSKKEQTLSVQYRILCKDGHIAFIDDISTSHRLEDGHMYAHSVISDISKYQEKTYADFLSIFSQFVDKYGFLRCTCDKFPKVTYINEQMKDYLGVTSENYKQLTWLKENIYFIIPFDEREAFRENLEKCLNTSLPLHIEHNFTRMNNTSIKLVGWISLIENNFGEKEFLIICMPASENHIASRSTYNDSYFLLLKEVYTSMFKINLVDKTVECIHGLDNSAIGSLYEVHVPVKDSINFWLNKHVISKDYDETKDFFNRIVNAPEGWDEAPVIQNTFRLKWSDGLIYDTLGVAVQLDHSSVLLCCRRSAQKDSSEQADNSFEKVTDNIYEVNFYNDMLSKENHQQIQSNNTNEDFKKNNSASRNENTHENNDIHESINADTNNNEIFARTFGHFDLFVNGIPVIFSSAKEKELMALLIDRNGGTLSPREAMNCLWEDEPITDKMSARYRKLAMTLKNTLKKYGIEHILINNKGVRSINVSDITCDYYELISGNEKYKSAFHNSYMTDYSWGEDTLATLWDYS